MKKVLNILLISAAAISFNVNAASFPTLCGSLDCYDTVVLSETEIDAQSPDMAGGLYIDPIIAYTSLGNSGDPTEIDWLTAVYSHLSIPDPVPLIEKIELDTEDDSDAYWENLGGGSYTGELTYGNDNYLIKIGEGQVLYDTFLYRNLADAFQATINLTTLAGYSGFYGNKFDIYRISHISEVPVPASIWLFGTALIGFVGISRKRTVG
jgi:hypothetical protein